MEMQKTSGFSEEEFWKDIENDLWDQSEMVRPERHSPLFFSPNSKEKQPSTVKMVRGRPLKIIPNHSRPGDNHEVNNTKQIAKLGGHAFSNELIEHTLNRDSSLPTNSANDEKEDLPDLSFVKAATTE